MASWNMAEEVWGRDEPENPFQIDISSDRVKNDLPFYEVKELQPYYSNINEFNHWAIEHKVCNRCRYPWLMYDRQDCSCGQYDTNIDKIKSAEVSAMHILNYHKQKILSMAKKMEEDLKGDSEYAQMNRKAQTIMGNRIARYNIENNNVPLRFKIFKKRTWKNWWIKITRLFKTTYWQYKLSGVKGIKRSMPLSIASDKDIQEMSFGSQKVKIGNCCIRTAGGAVIIVPFSKVDEVRSMYKGSEIVEPKIKC